MSSVSLMGLAIASGKTGDTVSVLSFWDRGLSPVPVEQGTDPCSTVLSDEETDAV